MMKKLRTLCLTLLLATLLSVTAFATETTEWTGDLTAGTYTNATIVTTTGDSTTTTITLTNDVALTTNLTISSGTVNLYLNGYTLTGATDGGSVITVNSGGTLNLYDTPVGETSNGTGTITGGTGTTPSGSSIASGGGVYVNGGTFNMHSGTISSNRAGNGGGVYVTSGTFTMKGGTISGNSATLHGGGVYLDSNCTFTMTNSTITGNSATSYGGGVYMGSSYTFTMTNSSIEDNSATGSGGGVYIYDGDFTMTNSTITGNSATSYGGGVYMGSSCAFTMTNSTITDNDAGAYGGGVCINNGADSFTVSGRETITGNTVNGIANNVYLWNNNSSENTVITIGTNFNSTSSIGISQYDVSRAFTSGATESNVSDTTFTSDLSAYTVTQGTDTDTELYLTLDTSDLFAGGNGTASAPYQIATLEQLSYLSLYGSNVAINANGVYYQLTADITLGDTYTPIGTTPSFVAQFDGNGHTIGGDIVANADNAGIFASIGSEGTVENLYSTVNVTNSSHSAGGIAGYDDGTIQNCYATGTITASSTASGIAGLDGSTGTIENCYATGAVTASGTSGKAGGIVGNNNSGTIRSCYATGNVTATSYAGGIAGYNSGTIENCLSLAQSVTGTDAGRVIGDDYPSTPTDNYAWSGVLVNGDTLTSNALTSKEGADLYFAAITALATTGTYGNTWDSILGFTQESYSVTVNTVNTPNIATVAGTYTLTFEGGTTYDGDEIPNVGDYDWTVYFTPDEVGKFPTFPVDSGTVTTKSSSSGSVYIPTTTTTTTTTTDTTTDTTTNDDGSITATVETETSTSNGTTSTTVDDTTIESAIESAVDVADGEDAHIEITVDTATSTDTVEVELTVDAMGSIADSDVESLTIATDVGSVTLSSDALSSIAWQASGEDITITIQLVDSAVLTQEQQTAVGEAQVYDLHITSGGDTITTFDGAEITVTLPYELAEGESAEHIVIWYLGDDGTMEALEGTYDEEAGTATFSTPHLSYYAALHHNNPFEDVDLDDYFFSPVMWAVEHAITNGTTDSTFSPDANCTRAQAVTLIWKANGSPVVNFINPFTDVSAEDYYYEAVLWATSEGITAGTSDTTFSPDATCTRGQIVTFLYRAAGEPTITSGTGFSDVASTEYYYMSVLWAVNNAITNGTSDTTFGPDATCTRGQIVTFLYRNLAE